MIHDSERSTDIINSGSNSGSEERWLWLRRELTYDAVALGACLACLSLVNSSQIWGRPRQTSLEIRLPENARNGIPRSKSNGNAANLDVLEGQSQSPVPELG